MLYPIGIAIAITFAVALLQWDSLRVVDELRVDATANGKRHLEGGVFVLWRNLQSPTHLTVSNNTP